MRVELEKRIEAVSGDADDRHTRLSAQIEALLLGVERVEGQAAQREQQQSEYALSVRASLEEQDEKAQGLEQELGHFTGSESSTLKLDAARFRSARLRGLSARHGFDTCHCL